MLKYLVISILLVLPSTSAAEWPMFQNDARATGFTEDIGPSDPEVKWRFDSMVFTAESPVLDEHGNVYVIKATKPNEEWSHIISAVSPEGEELWSYEFPRSGISTLSYSSKDAIVVAVAARNIDEKYEYPREGYASESFLLVVDSKSGVLRWKRRLSENYSDPWVPHVAIDSRGMIYAGGRDYLYAFTPEGEKLWSYIYSPGGARRAIKSSITRPSFSPDEKTVYVFRRQGGGLYAHDAKTGKKLWNLPGGYSDFSSPTIGPDGTVYMAIGGRESFIYALTPEGKVKWKKPFEGTVKDTNPALSGDGRHLFVDVAKSLGMDGGSIYSLDPKSGEILWEFELPPAYMVSPPALDGAVNVYYLHGDGTLYSLTRTGKLRYKIYLGWDLPPSTPLDFRYAQAFMSGPAIHDGRVYAIVGPAKEYGTLLAIGDKRR